MNKISKMQFSSNLIWKLAEQFSSVVVSLILAMILSRLLDPKDFGIIALTMVFISFSNIFVQAGFNTALIQKKETDALDFSTITILSMSVAAVFYIIIYLFAPFIADYYNTSLLVPVLRVLSIIILLNGLNVILSAAAMREMKFQLLFRTNLFSSVVSGIIGVSIAFGGYGIWALVMQALFQQFFLLITISYAMKWKFRIAFSMERAKDLFSFSSKVLGGYFIAFLSDNVYTAIIGKVYSTEDLGYSNRADTLPGKLVLNVIGALISVLLPTLSSYQDNNEDLKKIARKVVNTSTYIIFPMVFGLAVTAKGMIYIIFSPKWLPAAPLMQALCLWYLTIPLLQILGQVIIALGKTEVILKLEFVKMFITLSTLLLFVLTMKIKLYVLILIKGIISCFMIVINSIYTKHYTNYSLAEQLYDMALPFSLSTVMAGLIWLVTLFDLNVYYTVVLQVILGVGIYLGLSFFLKVESFFEIIGIIKKLSLKDE